MHQQNFGHKNQPIRQRLRVETARSHPRRRCKPGRFAGWRRQRKPTSAHGRFPGGTSFDTGHMLEAGVKVDENDFELTYSRMAKNGEHSAVAATIETEIYNYFDSLRLPPTPTLYDHLMLALRKKDVIATFNWDPLLLQAARRCSFPGIEFPRLLFLHGNVLSGFCPTDSVSGYRGNRCSKCGQEFQPSRPPTCSRIPRQSPMPGFLGRRVAPRYEASSAAIVKRRGSSAVKVRGTPRAGPASRGVVGDVVRHSPDQLGVGARRRAAAFMGRPCTNSPR